MATTPDVLIGRVRSLLVSAPFYYREAVSSEDFMLQGIGSSDAVFRVKLDGGISVGGFAYSEDRTDTLTVEISRHIAGDYLVTTNALVTDCNSIVAAIVRDGHETSGEYAVPDNGRRWETLASEGASYLTMRLTMPLNYEAQV